MNSGGKFKLIGFCYALSASTIGERSELILSAFDLGPQMVLRVRLRNVLDQRTVIRKEVGGDMDCFCVPNLAVFQAKLLRT